MTDGEAPVTNVGRPANRLSSRPRVSPGNLIVTLAWLVGVPLIAHFLFSWMGFNPTDDGFILALSRRILAGQVPHRDFISVHVTGSAYFHAPFVLLGGDYTFWISRLSVWFQFAVFAWCWILIAARLLKREFHPLEKFLLALIVFALSVHTMPILPWHTIDGIFFYSLGLLVALRKSRTGRWLGFFVIGLAAICKQSMLPIVLVTPFFFGEWRRLDTWIASFAPSVLYIGCVLFTGGLPQALLQLASRTDIYENGMRAYLYSGWLVGGILFGAVLLIPLLRRDMPRGLVLLAALALAGIPGYSAIGLNQGINAYVMTAPSFLLFGAAACAVVLLLVIEQQLTPFIRFGLIALGLAVSASISRGYNSPAMVNGPVALVLIVLTFAPDPAAERYPWRRRLLLPVALVLAAVTVTSFYVARRHYVYRDAPAAELTCPLDTVLPGGRGLRTNENTNAFLLDLKAAIRRVGDKPYAILPDCAGWWVKSPQLNPLPLDWVQEDLIPAPELLDRVIDSLDAHRSDRVVLVERFKPENLVQGLDSLPYDDFYAVASYVRANYEKIDQTAYFDIYR
jgi:hypothetical protein